MTRLTTAMTLLLLAHTPLSAQTDRARLAITQPALVVQCFNGTATAPRTRSWTVTAPVVLVLTMRNEPRPGMAPAGDIDPGTATVSFTPEPGHRYEVEVRAEAMRFSTRVWPRGEWTPVVRDRTTDAVVSSAPVWGAPPCQPAAPGQASAASSRSTRPSSLATSARMAVGSERSTPARFSSAIG